MVGGKACRGSANIVTVTQCSSSKEGRRCRAMLLLPPSPINGPCLVVIHPVVTASQPAGRPASCVPGTLEALALVRMQCQACQNDSRPEGSHSGAEAHDQVWGQNLVGCRGGGNR